MSDSYKENLVKAEAGDIKAMIYLADAYRYGMDDCEVDPEKGLFWIMKLADAKDGSAMFELALYYAKGYLVERDLEKALSLMEKASKAGRWMADKIAEDYRSAIATLKAAENGDAQAMSDISIFFRNIAESIDEDDPCDNNELALMWVKKAYDLGCEDAKYQLALCYRDCATDPSDKEKGIEMLIEMANSGDEEVQWELAFMYRNGRGVEENIEKAFYWGEMAAAKGYEPACMEIADEYIYGDLVEKNLRKAIAILEPCAVRNSDSTRIIDRLCRCYSAYPKEYATTIAAWYAKLILDLLECGYYQLEDWILGEEYPDAFDYWYFVEDFFGYELDEDFKSYLIMIGYSEEQLLPENIGIDEYDRYRSYNRMDDGYLWYSEEALRKCAEILPKEVFDKKLVWES